MTTPDTNTVTLRDLCNTTPRVSLTLRPGLPTPDWCEPGQHHYAATLRYRGRRMTVPFHTGSGWTADPDVADVLSCLLSDASMADNAQDFADYCSEFSLSTDSRSAEASYRECKCSSKRLHKFLREDFDKFASAEQP